LKNLKLKILEAKLFRFKAKFVFESSISATKNVS
jgi:hypothetical protein